MSKKQWIPHRIEQSGTETGTAGFKPQDAIALAVFMNQNGLKPGEVIVIDPEKIDICYWGVPETAKGT